MFGLTDTSFLPAWVPTQCVFTTEARRKRALFERIHDGIGRSEELLEDDPHSCTRGKDSSANVPKVNAGEVERTSDNFGEEEKVNSFVNCALTTLVWVFGV